MYAAVTATASQHNVLNIEARNVCRRMVKLGQTAHTNTLLMTTALTRNNVLFFLFMVKEKNMCEVSRRLALCVGVCLVL